MVSFEIVRESKINQGVVMKPDFRRADFRLLRELAIHADPTFPEDAGANVCFNIFKEWLETLCDSCIPKRRVRRGHQSTKPLWWTPEVGRVIEERQAAYRRSKALLDRCIPLPTQNQPVRCICVATFYTEMVERTAGDGWICA